MAIRWTRLLVVLAFLCAGVWGAVSAAAAPHLSPPGIAAAEQDQDGMLPPGDVPPPAPPDESSPDQGQDGMLPDGQTPDDDGDGVPDAVDSAPDDPTEGELPAPGPTDPVADNDEDGLPNVLDPDDNNNGEPDADEGVGTVDEVTPVPVKEEPAAPVANSPAPTTSGENAEPLVIALPSTGTGLESTSVPLPALLAGATLLLAAGGISMRSKRV